MNLLNLFTSLHLVWSGSEQDLIFTWLLNQSLTNSIEQIKFSMKSIKLKFIEIKIKLNFSNWFFFHSDWSRAFSQHWQHWDSVTMTVFIYSLNLSLKDNGENRITFKDRLFRIKFKFIFFFKSQIRTLIKMRSKKQNNSFDETMFNINWENVGEEFR